MVEGVVEVVEVRLGGGGGLVGGRGEGEGRHTVIGVYELVVLEGRVLVISTAHCRCLSGVDGGVALRFRR